jgi:Sec-independent protein secretion pathway component TatC
MHIGIQEIVLIIMSAVVAALLARRCHRPWLLGMPVQVAVISFCTPADPVSTLLIAVPCCLLYAFGVMKSGLNPEPTQ